MTRKKRRITVTGNYRYPDGAMLYHGQGEWIDAEAEFEDAGMPLPGRIQFVPCEDEAVESPRHYNSHPSGVECATIARAFSFNLGNVIKYVWRAGLKSEASRIEDLRKARWYIDDEIKRLGEGK